MKIDLNKLMNYKSIAYVNEIAQLEFIRSTKAIYKEKGIDLEVLEWGIQEFELVHKNS